LKTVDDVTTKYLVDSMNPTGHAQVVEETVNGAVQRAYVFGHALISQRQLIGGNWTTSYFGSDGNGSVRFLTDATGALTDTYNYDAFGALVSSTGSTPNDYLFVGEQFDANVGFYYLRARYMNPFNGRFVTRDTHDGTIFDPLTLHKYLYVANDPVNKTDPSGMFAQLAAVAVGTLPGYGEDAGQKIAIGAWLRFWLTRIGIGVIAAVSAVELAKRMDVPIRLHHYTEWSKMMAIMTGGINNPNGPNYFTPDRYFDADTAEDKLAVCHPLELRITLDIYPTGDGLRWPGNRVEEKQCPPGSRGGWANKHASGGGWENVNYSAVPYYSRKPQVFPLF
jgi:RHS repeat-associated protein